jgi:hypothetical protein
MNCSSPLLASRHQKGKRRDTKRSQYLRKLVELLNLKLLVEALLIAEENILALPSVSTHPEHALHDLDKTKALGGAASRGEVRSVSSWRRSRSYN